MSEAVSGAGSKGSSGGNELYRVPTADYLSFFTLSYQSAWKYWDRFVEDRANGWTFPESFYEDIKKNCYVSIFDVALVLILAFLWTELRRNFTSKFCMPLAIKWRLSPDIRDKFPESCFKLVFYSCTLSWSIYVMLLSGRYNTFWDPLSLWDEWTYKMAVPWDIYVTYTVQASFYLHSVYGTLYMDVWRKDSAVMIAHHFLTLALIGFSFAARHHMEGALVLLLHDVTDVELEFTKFNVYAKRRYGVNHMFNELLSNLGFACFSFSWFLFRLYWYPLKVLYVGLYGSCEMAPPEVAFVPLFNAMLWILLAMNTWWFHFILVMLYKVATGQAEELEDTREFEEEQEKSRMKYLQDQAKLQQNGNHSENGVLKNDENLSNGVYNGQSLRARATARLED